METKMRLLVLTVLVWVLHTCCHLAMAAMKTSSWNRLNAQSVATYQLALKSRSRLGCVLECSKYTFCNEVAFQRPDFTCYLLPSYFRGTSQSDITVLKRKAPACSPDASHADVSVTWHRRTLTSLEGTVTCPTDYMWSSSNTSVTCGPDITWTSVGKCLQHRWTFPATNVWYPIPFTVTSGWKMKLSGTPYSNTTRVSVNLFDAKSERPMKVKFNFTATPPFTRFFNYFNKTYLNVKDVTTSPAFPLQKSVPFLLDIVANSDSSFQVYVDGSLYHTYGIPVSVKTVVGVKIYGEAILQYIDLWCV